MKTLKYSDEIELSDLRKKHEKEITLSDGSNNTFTVFESQQEFDEYILSKYPITE